MKNIYELKIELLDACADIWEIGGKQTNDTAMDANNAAVDIIDDLFERFGTLLKLAKLCQGITCCGRKTGEACIRAKNDEQKCEIRLTCNLYTICKMLGELEADGAIPDYAVS